MTQIGRGWVGALRRLVGGLRPPTVRVASADPVAVTVTRDGRVVRVVRLRAGDELRLVARGLTSLNVEYCASEEGV